MLAAGRRCTPKVDPSTPRTLQVGPKPPRRPLGLIIKLKDDAVFMSAAGTAEFKPVAPALGLYKVKITDGQTPEAKAAQIRKQTGESVRRGITARYQQSMPIW